VFVRSACQIVTADGLVIPGFCNPATKTCWTYQTGGFPIQEIDDVLYVIEDGGPAPLFEAENPQNSRYPMYDTGIPCFEDESQINAGLSEMGKISNEDAYAVVARPYSLQAARDVEAAWDGARAAVSNRPLFVGMNGVGITFDSAGSWSPFPSSLRSTVTVFILAMMWLGAMRWALSAAAKILYEGW